MERRIFLKSLLAGGAIAAPALPALAGELLRSPDATTPVLLLSQSDSPPALTLAASIAAGLRKNSHRQISSRHDSGRQLRDPARINAALIQSGQGQGRGQGQGLIIGVMDDASALIFQEIAAMHGKGTLLQTQHRFAADGARHHCRLSDLDNALVWNESGAHTGESLAQFYADILDRQPLQGFNNGRPGAAQGSAYTSLVSFVIKA